MSAEIFASSSLPDEIKQRLTQLRDQRVSADGVVVIKAQSHRSLERNRVDALGVNEPVIAPGKDHRILIQLPGADERQREAAETSIKSAAFLKFCLVHKDNARLVANLFAKFVEEKGLAQQLNTELLIELCA